MYLFHLVFFYYNKQCYKMKIFNSLRGFQWFKVKHTFSNVVSKTSNIKEYQVNILSINANWKSFFVNYIN